MRSVETRSMAQLRAMESCLSQSVKNMKRRRGRGKVEEPADGSVDGSQTETLFVNGIKHLYPPIHSPELPRWSAFYELPKSTMTGTVAKEPPVDIPVEEGHPRPPHEEKEWSGEEIATANETEGENSGVEEAEDMLMDASYDKLMMDATRICFGCGASTNLRSQSNLWPEDNHTSSLMPASPMALPLAIPPSLATVGQRQLSKVSFTELLRFQENYGTAESLLSMLVRERQLAQACYYIFNEKVSKRLFVDVVAHHCLAHNQFHELQKVILEFDPSLRRVQEYLNVLKDFLRNRRALDLLYSYQVFTKDYVNAGLLAIQLFIASSTWDARVGHLQNAFAHLSVAHKLFRKRGKDDKEEKDTTEGVPEAADDSGQEMEAHLRRNLETVRLQMAVCEEMPEMAASLDLFGCIASQCEVAEQLLVAGQWELSQKIIDFLDLPAVELCVRASNQIATIQARSPAGSITPVVKFIEAIRKLPPVEWDSLVSNVVNIWIIEKAELKADPSAASQLIKFIQDERCRMDAHVLTGNLLSAFQIAQRLGNLQDVLHIRSCAQRAGDQELLKQMSSFLAYASPGKDYLTKNLAF